MKVHLNDDQFDGHMHPWCGRGSTAVTEEVFEAADQVAARKAYDAAKALLLTTLIGEAAAVGKNNGNREPTDAEVVAIIKKFIKGMDETLGYLGASNPDAKVTVLLEKDIISAYLPRQMSQEETENALIAAIAAVGKNMGQIMGYMKANYEGQYDGKLASMIVKTLI